MFTSNFTTHGKHPDAVSISIGKPRGWHGRDYPPLHPTRAMLKMAEEDFEREYHRILAQLNPRQVYRELGPNSILLCWEKFNDCCHRRMVAEWLEKHLSIEVPEFGHERGESIPFERASAIFTAKQKSQGKLF